MVQRQTFAEADRPCNERGQARWRRIRRQTVQAGFAGQQRLCRALLLLRGAGPSVAQGRAVFTQRRTHTTCSGARKASVEQLVALSDVLRAIYRLEPKPPGNWTLGSSEPPDLATLCCLASAWSTCCAISQERQMYEQILGQEAADGSWPKAALASSESADLRCVSVETCSTGVISARALQRVGHGDLDLYTYGGRRALNLSGRFRRPSQGECSAGGEPPCCSPVTIATAGLCIGIHPTAACILLYISDGRPERP